LGGGVEGGVSPDLDADHRTVDRLDMVHFVHLVRRGGDRGSAAGDGRPGKGDGDGEGDGEGGGEQECDDSGEEHAGVSL